MHERDIASDGGLHDEPPSVEDTSFLLVTRDHDTSLHSTGVVPNRDAAGLDSGVCTGRSEDAWLARRVGMQTSHERALRNELNTDLPVEVSLLEVLVPADAQMTSEIDHHDGRADVAKLRTLRGTRS